MKCLKGCSIGDDHYEVGDDVPTDGLSKRDLRWLVAKGCLPESALPKKGDS